MSAITNMPQSHQHSGGQGPPRPEVKAALTEKPHNTSGECFSWIQEWPEARHHREAVMPHHKQALADTTHGDLGACS